MLSLLRTRIYLIWEFSYQLPMLHLISITISIQVLQRFFLSRYFITSTKETWPQETSTTKIRKRNTGLKENHINIFKILHTQSHAPTSNTKEKNLKLPFYIFQNDHQINAINNRSHTVSTPLSKTLNEKNLT